MAILVTHKGIQTAVAALALRPGTQKARLLEAILSRLPDDQSVTACTGIDTGELVATIWPDTTPETSTKRRKQFTSLKSAINRLLHALPAEANPEGLVIGRNNVFEVSAAKKEELLARMGLDSAGDTALADQFAAFRAQFHEVAEAQGWSSLADLLQELADSHRQRAALAAELAATQRRLAQLTGGSGQEGDGAGTGEGDGVTGEEQELAGVDDQAGQGPPPAEEEEREEEIIEIDDDQELAVVQAGEAPETPGETGGPGTAGGTGEPPLDGEEEEEIIEIDDDQELAVVQAGEAPGGQGDTGGGEAEDGEVEIVELDEDEEIVVGAGDTQEPPLDGEEEEEEIIEIDDDQELTVVQAGEVSGGQGETGGGEAEDGEVEIVELDEDEEILVGDGADQRARNLFDALAEYMDAEAARQAVTTGETLDESREEYLARLLERFTPRFVRVPAGRHWVGHNEPGPQERPLAQVLLPAFHLGQTPVTNDLFELFVRETGYRTRAETEGWGMVFAGRLATGEERPGRRMFSWSAGIRAQRVAGADWRHPEGPGSSIVGRHHHPVVQVCRDDALAFAAWAGKRLPTEDEWEAAARGGDQRPYPWGDDWLAEAANLEERLIGGTSPVLDHGRLGASPYGVVDLLGNVYEWTGSWWRPAGGRAALAILKGGSWVDRGPVAIGHRRLEPPTFRANIVGFRCCV